MGSLTTWLTFVVLCYVAFSLLQSARRSITADGRQRIVTVWRLVSWRHIYPVPFVVAAAAAAARGLEQLPLLSFSWWSAIGGDGNPVAGMTDATSGTVWQWIVPLAFMAMFVPALPLLAYSEERSFRTGAETWSWGKRVARTILFGLVHALAGVSIAVALALSIGGAYFLLRYLRAFDRTGSRDAATLESTAAHTAYNAIIVAVFLAVVLTAAL